MTDEEVQQQARAHLRRWYEVIGPDATIETIINALMLVIAATAESAPRLQLRNEFLDQMRRFIDDLSSGRATLKQKTLQ